mmetsp:Transcript_20527/g.41370  ORF Transcript_20527/g.41370 Transcript_20527/m.41370 type:complete len:156 (+) Transcript_20527:111-578(+)
MHAKYMLRASPNLANCNEIIYAAALKLWCTPTLYQDNLSTQCDVCVVRPDDSTNQRFFALHGCYTVIVDAVYSSSSSSASFNHATKGFAALRTSIATSLVTILDSGGASAHFRIASSSRMSASYSFCRINGVRGSNFFSTTPTNSSTHSSKRFAD